MLDDELGAYLTLPSISIVEAMEKIDKNTKGILFVIDKRGRLLGSITDGDIRRWIIKTGELNARVENYMNMSPKYLFNGDIDKSLEYMEKNHIKAIPLLDINKTVVNVIFLNDKLTSCKNENQMLKDTNVIIMAGGKGTRLYPYTKILPKPLIPIGDIPIIERIINKFSEYYISNFFLTVNYKKNMIKSYFEDLKPQYNIQYIEEEKPLGTAGSIKLITNKFDSPIIITNCDTIIDTNYRDLMVHHLTSKNDLTIVSALRNITVPYGVIHSEEQGRVTHMEEKPKMSYFINTGLYVLNPSLICKIPNNTIYHMTELAELLISEGYKVGMYPISEDAFLDMGEIEEMKRMEDKLCV